MNMQVLSGAGLVILGAVLARAHQGASLMDLILVGSGVTMIVLGCFE